jgi:hypothetical protein
MTGREDGDALGVGPPDADAQQPPRPAAVELAAALLIVGGVVGLLGALNASRSLPAGSEAILALTVLLDVGAVVSGVLARTGRLWVLAVNYVAVLAFLDIVAAIGGSPLALVLGLVNVLVVVILIAHKPWFDAISAWRAARADQAARERR